MPSENEPLQPEETQDTQEEEKDWRAEYEKMRRHSRDWERRAKENEGKAKELDKLKEAQMTETERLKKQLADTQAQLDRISSERDHDQWAQKASAETGAPASTLEMIPADSYEDMLEKARKVAEGMPKASGLPTILGDGTHAKVEDKKTANDFLREQFARRR